MLKNLVKIWRLTRRADLLPAISRGYAFYKSRLLDHNGSPRPFARTQRLTLRYRDLYDYAEGINLSVLMGDLDPDAPTTRDRLVEELCGDWQAPDGHFVTRRYAFTQNRVPYHRWAQAQAFSSLVVYLSTAAMQRGTRPEASVEPA